MENLSYIELVLILGLYYFDKGKNINNFTMNFNQYFKRDIGSQTILFSLSKFKGVDPSNNIKSNSDKPLYQMVWKEYIEKEKFNELKELYNNFKKGAFLNQVPSINDILVEKYNINEIPGVLKIIDEPQEKPFDYNLKGINAYPRRKEVAINALAAANFKCEVNCSTVLFARKDGKINYTEAHHLIPLSYQSNFDYSLDIEANVVSLCPNCHCRLHYGFEPEQILIEIYNMRKLRLKSCGIGISFESLLLLYRL